LFPFSAKGSERVGEIRSNPAQCGIQNMGLSTRYAGAGAALAHTQARNALVGNASHHFCHWLDIASQPACLALVPALCTGSTDGAAFRLQLTAAGRRTKRSRLVIRPTTYVTMCQQLFPPGPVLAVVA
jgi:hypothetical protein